MKKKCQACIAENEYEGRSYLHTCGKSNESDYEALARMKREGKSLGNYRLPSGFGNDHSKE